MKDKEYIIITWEVSRYDFDDIHSRLNDVLINFKSYDDIEVYASCPVGFKE